MDVREMFGVYDSGIDGREVPKLKGVYETKGQADVIAGVYRSVSPVWMVGPTANGKWHILTQQSPVSIGVDFDRQREEDRATGLAKLTPEERAALGLSYAKP